MNDTPALLLIGTVAVVSGSHLWCHRLLGAPKTREFEERCLSTRGWSKARLPNSESCLELNMRPNAEHRDRPTIAVVGGVVDELIVGGDVHGAEDGDAVLHFKNLLGPGVRQLAVSDNPPKTTGGKIKLALARDAIGGAGQP
jgi:hypothetical protein